LGHICASDESQARLDSQVPGESRPFGGPFGEVHLACFARPHGTPSGSLILASEKTKEFKRDSVRVWLRQKRLQLHVEKTFLSLRVLESRWHVPDHTGGAGSGGLPGKTDFSSLLSLASASL
jgi:hypothetical protein